MIAIDSNILIYFLEDNAEFSEKAGDILRSFSQKNKGVCSEITISEIYANKAIINQLYLLEHLLLEPVSKDILLLAGKLRKELSLKVIDSIHVATAVHKKAKLFITNDKELAKKASKVIATKTL